MFRKLLTSFNWIVGTLAIVAALFSGLLPLPGSGSVEAHKAAMENAVEAIAKIEGGKRDLGGYVTFARNRAEMEKMLRYRAGSDDYDFEAFYENSKEGETDFVIRATTSDEAARTGRVPPLIYRYIIPGDGSVPRKEWVKLSGKKYGLGLF